MQKVHLLTLGCPKNTADSELMLGALVQSGFEITMDARTADVLVVNIGPAAVIEMAPDVVRCLRPGGVALVSGFEAEDVAQVTGA